ncbi:MAG: M48 family metallopeptidase [Saprospiraceae bacterium]|nr:M48 family metallopeptidase [Saprospiraceae bacterium]
MRIKKWLFILAVAVTTAFFVGCGAGKGGGFNLFSVDQDKELGKQTEAQIAADPKQFPVLPEKGNEELYRYVRGITAKLLNTGKVNYKEEFTWQVKIIDNKEVLNAFCTPGGYIYVYTGLIKFLDSEDQLAGVMGHEIAHAALRHSTRQMTQVYGIAALTSVVTGNANPGVLEQIALGLISLKFSRGHETEADEHSVIYLCETGYNAAGAAGFFKKMEGEATPPEFLSTHPNPGNRVQKIESKAQELGCKGTQTNSKEYDRIKRLIK